MVTKIGINGFGRIGRCVLRSIVERGLDDIEVALINDITDDTTLAHLLKYDSTFGVFKHDVAVKPGAIEVAGRTIKTSEVRDPKEIAWKAEGVDVVLECTGLFVAADKAKWHLDAGAKKVLLSAPGKGDGIRTVVLGVNDKDYNPKTDHIVSVGSCTTNCLAPVAKVLLDNFGIKYGLMTTTHSYTNDQNLLDLPHKKGDLRRARAAAVNMVPTTTGAARAVALVIPELKGKFDGLAIRVPTIDVSLVDLVVQSERPMTKESINAAMKKASEMPHLKGKLQYNDLMLVSSDMIGNPHSSVFDSTMTTVISENLAKVFSWYDNEWGFSNRMVDFLQILAASK